MVHLDASIVTARAPSRRSSSRRSGLRRGNSVREGHFPVRFAARQGEQNEQTPRATRAFFLMIPPSSISRKLFTNSTAIASPIQWPGGIIIKGWPENQSGQARICLAGVLCYKMWLFLNNFVLSISFSKTRFHMPKGIIETRRPLPPGPGPMIDILRDVQAELGHVPPDAIGTIASLLGISRIESRGRRRSTISSLPPGRTIRRLSQHQHRLGHEGRPKQRRLLKRRRGSRSAKRRPTAASACTRRPASA